MTATRKGHTKPYKALLAVKKKEIVNALLNSLNALFRSNNSYLAFMTKNSDLQSVGISKKLLDVYNVNYQVRLQIKIMGVTLVVMQQTSRQQIRPSGYFQHSQPGIAKDNSRLSNGKYPIMRVLLRVRGIWFLETISKTIQRISYSCFRTIKLKYKETSESYSFNKALKTFAFPVKDRFFLISKEILFWMHFVLT